MGHADIRPEIRLSYWGLPFPRNAFSKVALREVLNRWSYRLIKEIHVQSKQLPVLVPNTLGARGVVNTTPSLPTNLSAGFQSNCPS